MGLPFNKGGDRLNSREYIVRIKGGEYYEPMVTGLRVIDDKLYRKNPHNGIYDSYDLITTEYIEANSLTPLRRLLYLLYYNLEEVLSTIRLMEEDEKIGRLEVKVNATIPVNKETVKIKGLTLTMKA